MKYQRKPPFCDKNPIDYHFDVKNHPADTTFIVTA